MTFYKHISQCTHAEQTKYSELLQGNPGSLVVQHDEELKSIAKEQLRDFLDKEIRVLGGTAFGSLDGLDEIAATIKSVIGDDGVRVQVLEPHALYEDNKSPKWRFNVTVPENKTPKELADFWWRCHDELSKLNRPIKYSIRFDTINSCRQKENKGQRPSDATVEDT